MVFIIKRLGYLITKDTITLDFCKSAIIEASYRKHIRDNVRRVLDNIDDYAEQIRKMVLEETYEPAPYGFEIRIEHGKERKLQKPKFFPDQVIHHLLIMLIRDKLLKRIDLYAIASIPGRGQALGIKKLEFWIQKEKHARSKTKYCGKGDIRHCFESVKPEVVMNLYERFIKDKKYLRLMYKVVYSCPSLPLGNYCSAWTLNLLLKDMDNAIRNHPGVHHYLRYMDDFVFFCSNKKKAKQLREIIEKELTKLKLQIKPNYQIFAINDRGLDMIGYRFFRNYTILRRRNFKKIFRLAHKLKNRKFYTVYECQSLMSMLGQCRHCHASYIWESVGKMVNIYMIKRIISESSKEYSYAMLGRQFKPSVVLIGGKVA